MDGSRPSDPMPLRIQNGIAAVLAGVACIALLSMTVLLTVHVAMRATVGGGIQGADELSRYCMITVVYAGLAYTLNDGGFIQVDILLQRLPERLETIALQGVRLVSLLFMGLFTWWMYKHTSQSMSRGVVSTGSLRFPLWVPQSIVVVGSAALTTQIAVLMLWPGNSSSGKPPEGLEEAGSPPQV